MSEEKTIKIKKEESQNNIGFFGMLELSSMMFGDGLSNNISRKKD